MLAINAARSCCVAERRGVANVEHQHVIATDHALRLVDADTLELLAVSHVLAPSSWSSSAWIGVAHGAPDPKMVERLTPGWFW